MAIEGLAGKERPGSAGANGVVFREVKERAGDERVSVFSDTGKRVEIELSGALSECRQLGSLTERHGMRMHLELPLSHLGDRARASVAVPRAKTQREAEEAVASLFEWIPRA